MPKMKTHKASKRRFRVTATGKLRYNKAGKRHLNSGKPGQAIQKMGQPVVSDTAIARKIVVAITKGV